MVCSSILTRANGQETKARLLRTTETLFASKGVAGVTMRVVAKKAKTNLASAHYHFGSKEAMVLEMIKSKIEPINLKRRKRLDEAKVKFADKPLPNIEIFRALIRPVGEEVEKQITNQNGIIEIIARSFTEPAEFLDKIQKRFFGELSQVFMTELKNSNPDANEEDLYWNYHLAVSSMLGTLAQHRRMIDFSVGKYNENAVSVMIDRLIIFVSNGFEAGIQIKQ
ncbi:TetR/AcrR family transcriptional regulator [Opitutales bacterium]|nr:TetR/AcrR family transcriptional regulator [Opitutales bacterium]